MSAYKLHMCIAGYPKLYKNTANIAYCQAQPQLKPNWAELVFIPIPPTASLPE